MTLTMTCKKLRRLSCRSSLMIHFLKKLPVKQVAFFVLKSTFSFVPMSKPTEPDCQPKQTTPPSANKPHEGIVLIAQKFGAVLGKFIKQQSQKPHE